MEVHVLDRVESGLKPELVRELGATYHCGRVADIGLQPDVILESTGVGKVITDCVQSVGAGGILCLTGVGSGGQPGSAPTADVAAEVVLRNNVVLGSVNANKRHWYKATQVLARAEQSFLSRLITRCESPDRFQRALQRTPDDVKVVVQFSNA
jgi:glucose 1-dehydrogenase